MNAVEALVLLFQAAEALVEKELIRATARGAQSTARQRNQRLTEIRAILAELQTRAIVGTGTTPGLAWEVIRHGYLEGSRRADRDTPKDASTDLGGIHLSAAQELYAALSGRLDDAIMRVGRQAEDVLRKVALQEILVGQLAGRNRKGNTEAIAENLRSRGIEGFTDRAGRRWKLSTYAEMVAHTTAQEANTTATMNRLAENGIDTVRWHTRPPSGKHEACEPCRKRDGKVYSMTGATEGYEVLELAPPLHPRCGCLLVSAAEIGAIEPEPVEDDSFAEDFRAPDEADRKRLAIPPAWQNVKVARDPEAPLQATGVDAKGRKQSIYSAAHHERQGAAKFARVGKLHERLPEIDKRLTQDARTDDTALAALMIRRMGLRPGSDRDTGAEKKAHGATNLKASHIEADGGKVRANFTGKKGVDLDLTLEDPELAGLLVGRKEGKGGDDRLLDTDERKLRDYMSKVAPGVKPKDLRTYLGTRTAIDAVASMPVPKTKQEYKKQRREVGLQVSKLLGNTPTVALASYIAPAVFGPWDAAMVDKQAEMVK